MPLFSAFRYFRRLFADTWRETEICSREAHAGMTKRYIDRKLIVILVYVALGLTVMRYFGQTDQWLGFVLQGKPGGFTLWFTRFFYGSESGEFHKKLFWAGSILVIYMIIPMLIIRLGFRQPLKAYGLTFRHVHRDYPLYLGMLAVMVPIVYFVSASASFQDKYPIFQPKELPLIPVFLWWQLAYFLQFIAVEFFFRGFLVHGLKHRFGFYAVFISMIPYVMVHFGKPFGETVAAIFAGIILGTLSLKSRSVVLGILIHYSVAITMDLMALYREGIFLR